VADMLKVAAVELSSPIAVLISLKSYYSSFHNWDVSSVKQINILVFLTMFLREGIFLKQLALSPRSVPIRGSRVSLNMLITG